MIFFSSKKIKTLVIVSLSYTQMHFHSLESPLQTLQPHPTRMSMHLAIIFTSLSRHAIAFLKIWFHSSHKALNIHSMLRDTPIQPKSSNFKSNFVITNMSFLTNMQRRKLKGNFSLNQSNTKQQNLKENASTQFFVLIFCLQL